MRPACDDGDEGDSIAQRISSDSLSINGQNFTFDSVAHSNATQARFQVYNYFIITLNSFAVTLS